MRYKAVTDDFNVALPKSIPFFMYCYYNNTLKIHRNSFYSNFDNFVLVVSSYSS